jgi:hypothetical protein
MTLTAVILDQRGIVAVAGDDRIAFLQGIVSNDVARAGSGASIYAAMLTPQGRYLHDFFVVAGADALLLDCERDRADDLIRLLSRYRLRSKVRLEDRSPSLAVVAVFDPQAGPEVPAPSVSFADGIFCADPRLPAAGLRGVVDRARAAAVLARAGLGAVDADAYDRHRLRLGLPDGSRDLEVAKSLLLECGFDELNGVDWHKGCYLGQELTARTRYRGLVRKRLVPVRVDGPLPPPGTPVLADGVEAGSVRSGADGMALAMLRLDALRAGAAVSLTAGPARLTPLVPAWMRPVDPGDRLAKVPDAT